jgi:hypothetical protein
VPALLSNVSAAEIGSGIAEVGVQRRGGVVGVLLGVALNNNIHANRVDSPPNSRHRASVRPSVSRSEIMTYGPNRGQWSGVP